jgi:hypothetical protein
MTVSPRSSDPAEGTLDDVEGHAFGAHLQGRLAAQAEGGRPAPD